MTSKVVVANQGQHPAPLAGPVLSFNEKVARDLVRAAIARLDERAANPEGHKAHVLDAIAFLNDAVKWLDRQAEAERVDRVKALEDMLSAA